MTRFKFNYLTNTLSYQPINEELNGVWYQVSEEQHFRGSFDSQGFSLDSGWMTFSILSRQIKVFYKHCSEPLDLDEFWTEQKITYYRKYLAKQEEVIFTFGPQDEVEKVNGSWINKR